MLTFQAVALTCAPLKGSAVMNSSPVSLKIALTTLGVSIVNCTGLAKPCASPAHPTNEYPGSGSAVSVALEPCG